MHVNKMNLFSSLSLFTINQKNSIAVRESMILLSKRAKIDIFTFKSLTDNSGSIHAPT